MSTATLNAYRFGSQLWVWCPHEQRWHYHGSGGDERRGAHCTCPNSPFQETGYVLRDAGPLTPAIEREHGRPASVTRCPTCK